MLSTLTVTTRSGLPFRIILDEDTLHTVAAQKVAQAWQTLSHAAGVELDEIDAGNHWHAWGFLKGTAQQVELQFELV